MKGKNKTTAVKNQRKKPDKEMVYRLKEVEAEMNLGVNINDWKELGYLLNALRLNPARCGHLAKRKNKEILGQKLDQ